MKKEKLKWILGKQNGVNVGVLYTVPVSFRFSGRNIRPVFK